MARLDLTSCHSPDICTHSHTLNRFLLVSLEVTFPPNPHTCTSWKSKIKNCLMLNSHWFLSEKTLLHYIQKSTKSSHFDVSTPSSAAVLLHTDLKNSLSISPCWQPYRAEIFWICLIPHYIFKFISKILNYFISFKWVIQGGIFSWLILSIGHDKHKFIHHLF